MRSRQPAGHPSDYAQPLFILNYGDMGYVKDNHHLPDFPSGNEVAQNGIDVAKMDGKLLQKIEELTLYVIQLKSELEELKVAKK